MKKEFSLNKMKSYLGTNPKPKDFDSYWNKKIKVIDSFIPNVKIKRVYTKEFHAFEIYDVSFASFDGAKIYAKYLKPKTRKKVPCVLQFHGYPGSSRSFFELSAFVSQGMAVLAMDCRGQGGKSQDLGGYKGTTVAGHIMAGIDDDNLDNLLYTRIFQDAAIMPKVAMQLTGIDEKQIFVNGASQGGALAIVCSALSKHIKKAALLYPFLSDYQRVFELGSDQIAYDGLRYYSRWMDPLGENLDKWFMKLGYIDVHNFADRIQCPVIFGISLSDVVCPPSTQFAVYNHIKASKQLFTFPSKGHETIHEFDDRIIPFFLDQPINKPLITQQISYNTKKGIKYATAILRGNRPLAIFFDGQIEVKEHYLMRFDAIGYDVLNIRYDNIDTVKDIENLYKEVNKIIHPKAIAIVAESYGGALALATVPKVDNLIGCVIQSPVLKKIDNAKFIKCPFLLASGELDSISHLENNKKLFKNVKSKKEHLIYPRYDHERINDFEDKKMLFLDRIK